MAALTSWYLSVTARTAAASAWPRALATPAPPTMNASASGTARINRNVFTSHLVRNFVDVWGRVAGSFVNPHHGLTCRPGHEAEDLSCIGIQPRPLVVDALLALDREVATMG